jgi:putative transposase
VRNSISVGEPDHFSDEDYQSDLELAPDWRALLARVLREEDIKLLRSHEHTGRPLGDEAFLATLEQDLGRTLRRQKPGPKGKTRS